MFAVGVSPWILQKMAFQEIVTDRTFRNEQTIIVIPAIGLSILYIEHPGIDGVLAMCTGETIRVPILVKCCDVLP